MENLSNMSNMSNKKKMLVFSDRNSESEKIAKKVS